MDTWYPRILGAQETWHSAQEYLESKILETQCLRILGAQVL